MKNTVRIVKVLVGLLFIVSGLVKANDPLGLSYKMQEFFELWSAGFSEGSFIRKALETLHQHSLALSISMISLEIITGVALLLGWYKKAILWLLLLLIIFFSFLTGYAYLSGKFTNCGCFGDCLPITPLTSFLKDIALLLMISFLLTKQRFITPVSSAGVRTSVLFLSLLCSLGLQWYVLNYLPLADCLPFKKGNNISEQMKPPKNATPDISETRLVYKNKVTGKEKDMSQDEFNNSKIWKDTTWKWEETNTKLIKKGNNEAPLNGFSITGMPTVDSASGNKITPDSTSAILSKPIAVIGFGLGETSSWLEDFKKLADAARQKNVPVYFASNTSEYFQNLFGKSGVNVPVYSTDFTVMRIAARTPATFYIIKNGTIAGKYSYRSLNKLVEDLKEIN